MTHRLELDVDFEVIYRVWFDEDDCACHLGIPRGALYHVVPEALWGDLARFIEEYQAAIDNEREYRAGVEDTYRRNAL